MKFSTALIGVFAASRAVAAPAAEPVVAVDAASNEPAQLINIDKRASLNYVQNYNGNAANFQYDENAGTFSAKWGGNTDFVVGLGWTTGSAR